jgi:hypothetical protein
MMNNAYHSRFHKNDSGGRFIARTAAHVPDHRIDIDPESEKHEGHFSRIFGPRIKPDYVQKLNDCLSSMDNFFREAECGEIKDIASSVIYLKLRFNNIDAATGFPFMEILDVIVRPCVQGMGIFRVFMWRMMNICARRSLDMRVNIPTRHLREILYKISAEFKEIDHGDGKLVLYRHNMSKITVDSIGIRHMLLQKPGMLELNPDIFPRADLLNKNDEKNMVFEDYSRNLAATVSDVDMESLIYGMQAMSRKRGDRDDNHEDMPVDNDGGSSSTGRNIWTRRGRKSITLPVPARNPSFYAQL